MLLLVNFRLKEKRSLKDQVIKTKCKQDWMLKITHKHRHYGMVPKIPNKRVSHTFTQTKVWDK